MRRPLPRGMVLLVVTVLVASTGCFGTKKRRARQSAGALTANATYARGMELLARGKLRDADSVLKRIQFTPDLRQDLEPLARLALADATFHLGGDLSLIDARNLYQDFVTLNGDHPLAPYAQLQVGVCSLSQVNHPSKDQYQTHQAIEDLRLVEQRWPNSQYVDAARAFLRQARANLAESELMIGRFYLNRKAYPAAVQRLSGIVDDYPDFRRMETVLFHLGRAHLRGGNEAEGRIYLDKLLTDYPTSDLVAKARKELQSFDKELETDAGSSSD